MQLPLAVALLLTACFWSGEAARKPTTQAPAAGGELTDECPEPNGFFADGYQCDKYYECKDGQIEEKLCPDGMVFNDYSPQVEKCDLPFNIDCSQRPELQKPKPTLHCPRQNGYFAHEDSSVCDKFYFCVDGKFNMITCPAGLVYNERTGICTWPDEAKKKGCSSQDLAELATKWFKRPKRLTFWPKEEEKMRRKRQEEHRNQGKVSSQQDYNSPESVPNESDDYNGRRGEGDEEYSDYYDEGSYEDGPPPDYEFNLDNVIKAYVEQMNGVQAQDDLSYYERIGELSIDKDDGCGAQVFKFNCPKVEMNQAQQHPRYPDPEDCQFFYVCINGEVPRRNGCKMGQVFNEGTGSCDWPRNVPECKDWYKGILTDEELYALEHPKPRNRTSSAGHNNRRKHQQVRLEE